VYQGNEVKDTADIGIGFGRSLNKTAAPLLSKLFSFFCGNCSLILKIALVANQDDWNLKMLESVVETFASMKKKSKGLNALDE
jgi:hypothetical protein